MSSPRAKTPLVTADDLAYDALEQDFNESRARNERNKSLCSRVSQYVYRGLFGSSTAKAAHTELKIVTIEPPVVQTLATTETPNSPSKR